MLITIRKYYKTLANNVGPFISGLNLTDKKIMEYGMYLFAIVLFIGAAGTFKFIGIYLPALFLLIRVLVKGTVYKFWKSPIFFFLILFAFSGIISVFVSRDPWQSLIFFEKYHLRSILIYLVVVTVFQNKFAFRKLLRLLALTSIIYIVWSYYEYFFEIVMFGSIGRVTTLNAAWPLLYMFAFMIMEFFLAKTPKTKIFWVVTSYLAIVSLIISGQRAAVLGALTIGFIWVLFSSWKVKMIFMLTMISCIVTIVMLFNYFPAMQPIINDYVVRGVSSDGRSDLLTLYWNIFNENFWLGVGLDNNTISAIYMESERTGLLTHFMMPHNYFLTTAVRQGTFGLISFIMLIVVAITSLVSKVFRKKNDAYKTIGIALLSCVIGMYVVYAAFTEIVLMPLIFVLSLSAVYINEKSKQFS